MKNFSKLLLSFTFLFNSLICDSIPVRYDWVAIKWDAGKQVAKAYDYEVELKSPFSIRPFVYEEHLGNVRIIHYFNSAYRSSSDDSVHMLPLSIVSKFVLPSDVPRRDFLDTEGRHKSSGFFGKKPSAFASALEYKAVMSAYVDRLLRSSSLDSLKSINFDDLVWLYSFFKKNTNDLSATIQQDLIKETKDKITAKILLLDNCFAGKREPLELYNDALIVLKALSLASCLFEYDKRLDNLASKAIAALVAHLSEESAAFLDEEALDKNDIRNAYVNFYYQYCDVKPYLSNIKKWCSDKVKLEAAAGQASFEKSLKAFWAHLSMKDKFKSIHRCHPGKMTLFWITVVCLSGYGCYKAREKGLDEKAVLFTTKQLQALSAALNKFGSKPGAASPSNYDDIADID